MAGHAEQDSEVHCIHHVLCACVLSCFSHVWLFVTLWTIALQASLSMVLLQARKLEWVAMPSSSESYPPRDWTRGYCITGGFYCITGGFFTAEPSGSPCAIHFSHSVVSDSLWSMECCTPGLPVHHQHPKLLKRMSFESVMPSNHLILCHPLLLLPLIFLRIRVFSNESVLHIRWPKYWSFNFSISTSNEFQGWFPLELIGFVSLQSKGLSRIFSNTTVQKHQFFSAQLSLWSSSHIHTWLLGIR